MKPIQRSIFLMNKGVHKPLAKLLKNTTRKISKDNRITCSISKANITLQITKKKFHVRQLTSDSSISLNCNPFSASKNVPIRGIQKEKEDQLPKLNLDTKEQLSSNGDKEVAQTILQKSLNEDMKNIRVYSLAPKNLAIMVLQHPTTLMISGAASLRVLAGTLHIHGYALTPSQKEFLPFFSSAKCGFYPISTALETGGSTSKNVDLESALSSLGAESLSQKIQQELQPGSVILAIKDLVSRHDITYASNVMNLPFCSHRYDAHTYLPLLGSLEYKHRPQSTKAKLIEPSLKQKYFASQLLESYNNNQGAPIVLLCGGRNTGKSTFLSYLINTFLQKYDHVYHLDMDPGQPEFTPPGCVSLTKVSSPLFGPSFTHQQQPEKSIYLGQVNIGKIGPSYHEAMLSLLNHYNCHHLDRSALFVNTMGWTMGLGYQLLIDLIRHLRPTHLIQLTLEDNPSANSLPSMSPSFLASAPSWSLMNLNQKLNYQHWEIPCARSKPFTSALNSHTKRDLMICAYLGQLSRTNLVQPVTAFPFYSIQWNSIALCFCNDVVPPSQVFQVLNSSFVALCAVEPEVINAYRSSVPELPTILPDLPMNRCLGFGVIINVDPIKKVFNIVTPEPYSVLSQVNALFHGQTTLPDEIFLNQEFDGTPVPHVGELSFKSQIAQSMHQPIKKTGTTVKKS